MMSRSILGRKPSRTFSTASGDAVGPSSRKRERTVPLPVIGGLATMIVLTGLVISQLIGEIF